MRPWPSWVYEWGSQPAESALPLPCDELVQEPRQTLLRAVSSAAPAGLVFRWLCQLRAAPYSYDRLDNGGRRSPQILTPGLEELEVGQRVMRLFRLAAFETGRSITIETRGWLFGHIACTYAALEAGPGGSRLLARMHISRPGPAGAPSRLLLPPGDLVMMRRQLLNLAALAERDHRSGAGVS